MNDRLAVVAAGRGGWFSREDARECGYTDCEIRMRIRAGRWVRLCRGAYAVVDPAEQACPRWERERRQHVRIAQAIQHRLDVRAAISHQSAVAAHGLPTWGLDLGKVHVTRLSGHGRSDDEVVQHAGCLGEGDLVMTSTGAVLTTVARSVVEAARLTTYQSAVVMTDAALNRRLVSADDLAAALEVVRRRPGASTAVKAVGFADAGAESPGESRLRVLLADQGLPTPVLQAELLEPAGTFVARVDFLFPDERVVVEFDGETKYGDRPADAVIAEKWREDRIRELGYIVVRISWSDLAHPKRTAERIRRAIDRARRWH
jgi:putative AbiEi antitoxin of type IV toxin-antitoxin system